ncbi:carbohydrate porin [Lichenicoccus sp.]|uniref:carbohydrate porin n=1 Tax=Lichenicoccus sp. TaxID=2781899 RepID=UPI003D0B6D55
MFGDWGGARTWLDQHGVSVSLDWLTENSGNGGRRQSFDFAGQVGLEVDLDLDELAGLKGSAFHVMIVNGNGRRVSIDAIGEDLATTQEICGGRGNVVAHLVHSYWEQSIDHDRIDLVGGWLPVGTYFAASPRYCRFMNVLFCGNPHPLPNYPGEQNLPQASFGGQIRWIPIPQLYAMLGLHQTDTDFGTGGGGISGWAWAGLHKSGVSIPLEIGWVPRLGRANLRQPSSRHVLRAGRPDAAPGGQDRYRRGDRLCRLRACHRQVQPNRERRALGPAGGLSRPRRPPDRDERRLHPLPGDRRSDGYAAFQYLIRPGATSRIRDGAVLGFRTNVNF